MPTYQYKCDSCGDEFEKVLSISSMNEPCDVPCESCSNVSVRRKISGGLGFSYGQPKLDGDFKDIMKGIKKASGRSNTIPDY